MNKSDFFYEEAKEYIPGGVNSPVRAFRSVGRNPIFFSRGKGSKIIDVNGNEYIDCVMSWGPLILGHAYPKVIEAVTKAAAQGTSFGAPTEAEIDLARLITEMVPGIDKVRLVNSGTEATMSAVRLARGYTKRDIIIKFEGCYHGHSDSFLIKGGSGALTLGHPSSPGVTRATTADTLCAQYNDLESVTAIFEKLGDDIACVIVEPIAGNMGVVLPDDGFLQGLREITSKYEALLIFDEVITGFRIGEGGAQQYYNVDPDLTTLGKIIGGGLPVGAFGGKKEIMDRLAPDGPVYQAGTLSGNPIATAAGLAVLSELRDNPPYDLLEARAGYLYQEIENISKNSDIPVAINKIGSMGCMFFTNRPVTMFSDVMTSNTDIFTKYYNHMLDKGIYCAPSQYEASFISTAHSENDIERIVSAVRKTFQALY